ncbi:MAG: GNAT family N-acetyltransferase [Phenylobacterium sp.]
MAAPADPPVEIGFATSADVADILAVLREGAVRMAEKGGGEWDIAKLTPALVAPFVERAEFLVAKAGVEVVGCCTLTRVDPEFWPEDPPGEAAYIHRLAARRAFAGGRVTRALVEHCLGLARGWGCRALRLDCHPKLRAVYAGLGFTHVDTGDIRISDGRVLLSDRFEIRL